jgi:hypothetical protein
VTYYSYKSFPIFRVGGGVDQPILGFVYLALVELMAAIAVDLVAFVGVAAFVHVDLEHQNLDFVRKRDFVRKTWNRRSHKNNGFLRLKKKIGK